MSERLDDIDYPLGSEEVDGAPCCYPDFESSAQIIVKNPVDYFISPAAYKLISRMIETYTNESDPMMSAVNALLLEDKLRLDTSSEFFVETLREDAAESLSEEARTEYLEPVFILVNDETARFPPNSLNPLPYSALIDTGWNHVNFEEALFVEQIPFSALEGDIKKHLRNTLFGNTPLKSIEKYPPQDSPYEPANHGLGN